MNALSGDLSARAGPPPDGPVCRARSDPTVRVESDARKRITGLTQHQFECSAFDIPLPHRPILTANKETLAIRIKRESRPNRAQITRQPVDPGLDIPDPNKSVVARARNEFLYRAPRDRIHPPLMPLRPCNHA